MLGAVQAFPVYEYSPPVPWRTWIVFAGIWQVTAAYLLSLAAVRAYARVATLDEGPVRSRPERTLLIPALP